MLTAVGICQDLSFNTFCGELRPGAIRLRSCSTKPPSWSHADFGEWLETLSQSVGSCLLFGHTQLSLHLHESSTRKSFSQRPGISKISTNAVTEPDLTEDTGQLPVCIQVLYLARRAQHSISSQMLDTSNSAYADVVS